MTDIVNAYFKRFYPQTLVPDDFEFEDTLDGGMLRYRGRIGTTIFPSIKCADGFSFSAQGHAGAYSVPRDDFASTYLKVECGYPSASEELLIPYYGGDANEPSFDPCQSVYAWVPIDVVEAVIAKHGGIAATEQEG
jgi:hypothetical protein